jgi:hypothetical protein
LSEAARRGHDIRVAVSALETLSDNKAVPSNYDLTGERPVPSWCAKSKKPVSTVWLSVGKEAISAATHHYRHRRDGAALNRLIAAGGLVAARAVNALRSAEHTEEIAMVMPLVLEQLSNADVTICLAAAALLVKYYFLAGEWDAISDLLERNTETVRRGALATLDDLAEAEHDLTPVLPPICPRGRRLQDTRRSGGYARLVHPSARQDVRDLLRVERRRPHVDCRSPRQAQNPQAVCDQA